MKPRKIFMLEPFLKLKCAACRKKFMGFGNQWYCVDCHPMVSEAQIKAIRAVRAAVVKGIIKPARKCKCVDCGYPAHCYDHRDYTKPLKVDAVCRACNYRRGPAKGFYTRLKAA